MEPDYNYMRRMLVAYEHEFGLKPVHDPALSGHAYELVERYRTDVMRDTHIQVNTYDTVRNKKIAAFVLGPPDGYVYDLNYFIIGVRQDGWHNLGMEYLQNAMRHEMCHIETDLTYGGSITSDEDERFLEILNKRNAPLKVKVSP